MLNHEIITAVRAFQIPNSMRLAPEKQLIGPYYLAVNLRTGMSLHNGCSMLRTSIRGLVDALAALFVIKLEFGLLFPFSVGPRVYRNHLGQFQWLRLVHICTN